MRDLDSGGTPPKPFMNAVAWCMPPSMGPGLRHSCSKRTLAPACRLQGNTVMPVDLGILWCLGVAAPTRTLPSHLALLRRDCPEDGKRRAVTCVGIAQRSAQGRAKPRGQVRRLGAGSRKAPAASTLTSVSQRQDTSTSRRPFPSAWSAPRPLQLNEIVFRGASLPQACEGQMRCSQSIPKRHVYQLRCLCRRSPQCLPQGRLAHAPRSGQRRHRGEDGQGLCESGPRYIRLLATTRFVEAAGSRCTHVCLGFFHAQHLLTCRRVRCPLYTSDMFLLSPSRAPMLQQLLVVSCNLCDLCTFQSARQPSRVRPFGVLPRHISSCAVVEETHGNRLKLNPCGVATGHVRPQPGSNASAVPKEGWLRFCRPLASECR